MENSLFNPIKQMEKNTPMSLLEEAYQEIQIIDRVTVDDGYGGTTSAWVDGIKIQGAITFNNSNLAVIAQALGTTASYTLTVKKNVDLNAFQVLKRLKDNKTFRIVSGSDDNETPQSAGLNMRQYSLEEFTIPT